MPRSLPICDPQPSQLYLNGRKLALATEWFDFDDPTYDPIPARQVDGEWVLLDGHTRAFLAVLSGADELEIVVNHEDLPMAVYRECISWCKDERVTSVGDLCGRVLNPETFEERWIERCHRAADRIEG